jgi:hypothetical protein
MGGLLAVGAGLRTQLVSTEAYWMNPRMSNGATGPCDAGTIAGVGGKLGLCAEAASVIHSTASMALIFLKTFDLQNFESITPL